MGQYTTSAAAALLGVARQTIRAYGARYARFLSTEGAPAERGQARRFTEADLKTLAYVRDQTKLGATHEDIATRLTSGALDSWDWHPEGARERISASHDDQSSARDDIGGPSALIPAERLLAAQALLQDAQARLAAEEAKSAALQAELRALERALGKSEGELEAAKAQTRPEGSRKGFWARLLGSG